MKRSAQEFALIFLGTVFAFLSAAVALALAAVPVIVLGAILGAPVLLFWWLASLL